MNWKIKTGEQGRFPRLVPEIVVVSEYQLLEYLAQISMDSLQKIESITRTDEQVTA